MVCSFQFHYQSLNLKSHSQINENGSIVFLYEVQLLLQFLEMYSDDLQHQR